ncbi:MAG: hypothetical protein CMB60_03145 [Euryarchaeota archaeon]|nr:hypothetical protein [Euryarchaeota archaeon]|tara:strand:+ start:545 stop:940 length:396 start_codon:yes stop_codon:yes gene_type:complete
MDEDTWKIVSYTGVGGFCGWINAKYKVDQACDVDTGAIRPVDICWNGSDGITTDLAEANLNSLIESIYPSSILTGLVIGLFIGIVSVKIGRMKIIFLRPKFIWSKVNLDNTQLIFGIVLLTLITIFGLFII